MGVGQTRHYSPPDPPTLPLIENSNIFFWTITKEARINRKRQRTSDKTFDLPVANNKPKRQRTIERIIDLSVDGQQTNPFPFYFTFFFIVFVISHFNFLILGNADFSCKTDPTTFPMR